MNDVVVYVVIAEGKQAASVIRATKLAVKKYDELKVKMFL
jgi:hypothetical protein